MSLRTIGVAFAAALQLTAAPASAKAADAASATGAHLHRGVNVMDDSPIWGLSAATQDDDRDLRAIRSDGFDFVRLVLHGFKHMDAANRLDPFWMSGVDRAVQTATAAGLDVILDEHDYNLCSDDPIGCGPKLTAFWAQMGPHFRAAPATVQFELLNEPHAGLNGDAWNALLAQLVPVVRETNPGRTLLIGPTHWNSLKDLPLLELPPDDRNIIVEVHYYEPMHFTHQGAAWANLQDLHGVAFTSGDAQRVHADFDRIAAWSGANRRPVLLGEFGAYDGGGGPVEDRARYDATVRGDAEAHGFAWAYWDFDAPGFMVYSVKDHRYLDPIHRALMPK